MALTAAVASVSARFAVAEVGPLCCMLVAQGMPTSASETTIEMTPKARPIARVIGPWVASLESNLDQDSAQLASSARPAPSPEPKPLGAVAGLAGAGGGDFR